MFIRKTFTFLIGCLLGWALAGGSALASEAPSPANASPPSQEGQPLGQPPVPPEVPASVPLPGPLTPGTPSLDTASEPPNDPCLPSLYKDWREFSADPQAESLRIAFPQVRILIDRSTFELTLEGVQGDASAQELYRTPVALGDLNSPTPEGRFVLNHIYCYPDVVFFDEASGKVPNLYRGFFAPVLACDETGHCERFRELGIHGFDASAHPRPQGIVPATNGPVSGGCIRVPDPCKLKQELIRVVGVGPIKKNDRGCYHWLKKPVEVVISGYYPGTGEPVTIVSILQEGLQQVRNGLKGFFEVFLP